MLCDSISRFTGCKVWEFTAHAIQACVHHLKFEGVWLRIGGFPNSTTIAMLPAAHIVKEYVGK